MARGPRRRVCSHPTMDANATESLSRLLEHVDGAHKERLTRIFPLIYDDLRRIARRYMSSQSSDHTLQPTALVNEAFLRIRDRQTPLQGQSHALAVAAVAMRCILVDHARARLTQKRGGAAGGEGGDAGPHREFSLRVEDEPASASQHRDVSILELDDLLKRLHELDARRARVVELRFFGGMTNDEVAAALGMARSTVAEDWSVARAWLRVQLGATSKAGERA